MMDSWLRSPGVSAYAADAPGWLAHLPAVDVLRIVLLQNYVVTATSYLARLELALAA
jgi:hypothetical protein